LARQELLFQVATEQLSMAVVLAGAATDPLIARTKVSDLLEAVPGCDPAKLARILTAAEITEGRRVGALRSWQHRTLLNMLNQLTGSAHPHTDPGAA
jgi:hypothetical protein